MQALTVIGLTLSSVLCTAQYPGSKYYPVIDGNDVTFRIVAPEASSVKIYGDFLPGVNEYNLGGHMDMTRDDESISIILKSTA